MLCDRPPLVSPSKYHPAIGGRAANDTLAGFLLAVRRNTTDGSFGLVLHALFAGLRAAPVCPEKPAFLEQRAEFSVVVDLVSVFLAEGKCLIEETFLNVVEH